MAQALFEQMRGKEALRPGWHLARLTAYALALMVHAVTALVLVGGLWLLYFGWPSWVEVGLGVLLVLVAAVLRPRLGWLGSGVPVTRRDDAPRLFALIDDVAEAVGGRAPDLVVIDGEYNARFGIIGLRRRRVLWIGLPMWRILTRQEQVGLLGHELAHGVNGDSRYGLVVGTALQNLRAWKQFTFPRAAASDDISRRLLACYMRMPIMGVIRTLERLNLRAAQRAEYLADEWAARTGSSEAEVSSLKKLMLGEGVVFAMSVAARRGDRALGDVAAQFVAAVPTDERQRLERIARLRGHQAAERYPPTPMRVDLILSRQSRPATVLQDAETSEAISDELAERFREVEADLRKKLLAADPTAPAD
ncbi:MAG: hypothetical protein QOJ49_1585 [Actinomycetota bacterium]|jgi:Zn-dependent protease with chaperone function|nr:hypothetical protein [Actinomycetota bacterium]